MNGKYKTAGSKNDLGAKQITDKLNLDVGNFSYGKKRRFQAHNHYHRTVQFMWKSM